MVGIDWVEAELNGVALPDQRYRKNLQALTGSLCQHVGQSFSAACGERLRKSAWRLFSQPELDLQTTHRQRTLERCQAEAVVLVVEDTTAVNYTHHPAKKGMGILGGAGKRQAHGVCIHSALALSESGAPLGLLHQRIWDPAGQRGRAVTRRNVPLHEKESYKWIEVLDQLEHTPPAPTLVVVADREADFYEHFAHSRPAHTQVLVRLQHRQRSVYYGTQRLPLSQVLAQLPPWGTGQIQVGRRPNYAPRTAQVEYYATTVGLPATYKRTGAVTPLQVIWVKERGTHPQALEWILLTSLAVNSFTELLRVVGYYTRRWTIERFHLVLKAGLRIEQLQIDQLGRLQNALQLYSLVAWYLVWLYKVGQLAGSHPAQAYFEAEAVVVLETATGRVITSVGDFLLALGKLAGFRPTARQPMPGEKSVWIGLRQFLAIQTGFELAKRKYGTG